MSLSICQWHSLTILSSMHVGLYLLGRFCFPLIHNWQFNWQSASCFFPSYLVHKKAVVVPGVPSGDHGNWK